MRYKYINLMVPSYRRPGMLRRLVDSAMKTANDVDRLRFTICANVDDEETRAAIDSWYWHDELLKQVIDEETDQPNLAMYFNLMYNQTDFNAPDTLVSMLGDDMMFITPGWDDAVLETINRLDGQAVVYLNDDYIAGQKLTVNMFTTRDKMVDPTGMPFMCPLFHAEMIDTIWTSVGCITGTLQYLEAYTLKHDHATRYPEGEWDDTFKRLSAVQRAVHAARPHSLAMAYATWYAAKLIEAGVGTWNKLPETR